jgi:hypothetical protein
MQARDPVELRECRIGWVCPEARVFQCAVQLQGLERVTFVRLYAWHPSVEDTYAREGGSGSLAEGLVNAEATKAMMSADGQRVEMLFMKLGDGRGMGFEVTEQGWLFRQPAAAAAAEAEAV